VGAFALLPRVTAEGSGVIANGVKDACELARCLPHGASRTGEQPCAPPARGSGKQAAWQWSSRFWPQDGKSL